jgi:acyl-CoA thioesterase-1
MIHPRRRFTGSAIALLAAVLGCAPLRAATAESPTLLVLGDSISAGYGLPSGSGWVDLLSARLKERRYPIHVANASISGDTTAGGRARLPGLLAQYHPAIVVIELGGNDGLRGGNLKVARENLDFIAEHAKRAGAKVLLVALRMPPNYGSAYTREFDAMYTATASAQKIALVPFLFEGFAERDNMFQPDRIHPTAAAQPLLLDNVWPHLEPLLGKPR